MELKTLYSDSNQRLLTLQVRFYDLFLDLDFKGLKFTGKVVIELESEVDATLNAVGLEILQVKGNGKRVEHKQKGEDLLVKTGPFSGALEIEYQGVVSDALVGLYKAPYGDNYVVSTQFEAANARRLLPCVDHPAYKAEFKVRVRTDSDLSVISNMPVESVNLEGGKKTVAFQKTPRMSTYLLYLGVGKFDEEPDKSSNVIVAATPGKAGKTKLAQEAARESLKFYSSYFGSPYQLPKLHLLAIPEFAAGAMENWGAITFREVYLLSDENTSVRTRKLIAEVVAHEVAHQWFGNLVTMKWWDDLWLNESFATFMAYKVVDFMFPQWKVWQDFLRADTSVAMARDSLWSTHPVQVKISDPSEIEQFFDQISYSKGASIIRMIEAYTGPENFMKGVRTYLDQHKFSNAAGSELWSQLERVSGTQVQRIMSEWITRPGYPILTVALRDGKLAVRQERFLLSGTRERGTWPVPVTIRLNHNTRRLVLGEEEEEVDAPRTLHSVKLNVDQTGFYRVYYEGLYDLVWNGGLSAQDRFGIISDAFAFTIAGRMSFENYLALVSRYYREEEYLPSFEVSDQLAFLYSISPGVREVSNRFHRSQLEILKAKADENSVLLKGIMAYRLALADREYAQDLAKEFADYERVAPDMRQATAVAYARASGDFEGLVKKYKESGSDEEKARLLSGLMGFENVVLISRSLDLATSGEVKRQEVPGVVLAGSRNPDARNTLWPWVKSNLKWLNKLYEGTGTVSRLLMEVIPFVGIGRAVEVERFFAENKLPELGKGVEAGLEKLAIYDEFVQRIRASQDQLAEIAGS